MSIRITQHLSFQLDAVPLIRDMSCGEREAGQLRTKSKNSLPSKTSLKLVVLYTTNIFFVVYESTLKKNITSLK